MLQLCIFWSSLSLSTSYRNHVILTVRKEPFQNNAQIYLVSKFGPIYNRLRIFTLFYILKTLCIKIRYG